jgi:ketosteroid isomerase-like protein
MTLRRAMLVAALGCTFSFASNSSLPAQTRNDAPDPLRTLSRDELDIVKIITSQENAWNRGDLNAYAATYKNSPADIFIGGQITHGFDRWLADDRQAYPNRAAMGTLAFSAIEPHLLDEHYATVIGRYHLDRSKKAGGAADGVFSLVLEKTPEGWKIILDHTT